MKFQNGLTPLMNAVNEGFFDFFVYLLSIDEVSHTKTCRGFGNILFCAAFVSNMKFIDYIIKNKLYIPGDCTIWHFSAVNKLYKH